jgi:hypothetical protein
MEAAGRRVLDRLLRPVAPRPVESFTPEPHELTRGVWLLDRQLRFPGGPRLPCRSTVVRLGSEALVVLSPPPLPGDALERLGRVEYAVVPNTFHYVYALELLARHPSACLLVAPGVRERVPELGGAGELSSTPPAAWSGELDLAILGPVRGLSEVIFFHRPTGSLILTDLAFHLLHYPRAFDRIVWRAGGIPPGFGPGRTSRALLLGDRAEASRCLGEVVRWPFERIILAHGEVIEHDARARFLRAFDDYLD